MIKNVFTIDEVRSFWDEVARTYEGHNARVGYIHTQRFEKTMEYGDIEPGMSILNIWSRTGNLSPWLRTIKDLTIHHREVSPMMLEIARMHYPKESFQITDLENLTEYDNDTFDRIISLETLEHTPDPLRFLQELQRVTKTGGRLIMSLPPKGAEIPEFFYRLLFDDHGEGPHRFLWSWEVKKLLKTAGWHLRSYYPCIMLPTPFDSWTRWSEKILTHVFGWTPLKEFGVRQFFIAEK